MPQPFFLLASERSGTNLLRSRLDNHTHIAAPPPLHLMKAFYDRIPFYGSLDNHKNVEKLIKDVLGLFRVSIGNWDVEITQEELMGEIADKESSFLQIFKGLYDIYTRKKNKNTWFVKEHYLYEYAFPIKYFFPNSKFIYLVRDPRDVFLSNKKRPYAPKTSYSFMQIWEEENKKFINLMHEKAFEDSILFVKYEDLIQSKQKTFENICDFIGVPFETNMLKGTQSKVSERTKQWENIAKEIIPDNSKKYARYLSANEIKVIEKIGYNEMKYLQYPFEYEHSHFTFSYAFRKRNEIIEKTRGLKSIFTNVFLKRLLQDKIRKEYRTRRKRWNYLNQKIKNS